MIEVRIRWESQTYAESRRLCAMPFDRLDEVIPLLKRWGVADARDEMSAQFVLDDQVGAYFEVILHEGEE